MREESEQRIKELEQLSSALSRLNEDKKEQDETINQLNVSGFQFIWGEKY